jgi:hypothetical protein
MLRETNAFHERASILTLLQGGFVNEVDFLREVKFAGTLINALPSQSLEGQGRFDMTMTKGGLTAPRSAMR